MAEDGCQVCLRRSLALEDRSEDRACELNLRGRATAPVFICIVSISSQMGYQE